MLQVDDGEVPAAPADSSPLDDAPASSGAEPGDGGYDEGEPLDNEQAGPADVEGLDDAGEPGAAPEDGEEGTGGEGEAGAGAEAPGDGESPEAAAEAEAAAAAPPPPVELEPLPEDYVPVRDLPPIPEPFARNEEGKPVPLDGVESLFLTGQHCLRTGKRLAIKAGGNPAAYGLPLKGRSAAGTGQGAGFAAFRRRQMVPDLRSMVHVASSSAPMTLTYTADDIDT